MSHEMECPDCGELIEMPDFPVQVTCLECQNDWLVDTDCEFVDGCWRDRTKLVPVDIMWRNRAASEAPSVSDGGSPSAPPLSQKPV